MVENALMDRRYGRLLLTGCACLLTAGAGQQASSSEPTSQAAASGPASQAVVKPADESLTINFDTADAALSPRANSQLDGAARLYRDARPEVMIISGHSDRTGGEFANLVLSARRADAVKKALIDRGIPAERLQIVAIGQAEPVASVPPSRSAVVTWR